VPGIVDIIDFMFAEQKRSPACCWPAWSTWTTAT
jgi:hypothetical protein